MEFTISEDPTTIDNVVVTFIGSGEATLSLRTYIWNFTSTAWVEFDDSPMSIGTTETTDTATYDPAGDFSDFIDGSNKLHVLIMDDDEANDNWTVDYLKLVVNYDTTTQLFQGNNTQAQTVDTTGWTDGGTFTFTLDGDDSTCGTALTQASETFTWNACTETETLTLDAITDPITGAISVNATGSAGASNIEVQWRTDGGSWSGWQANGSTYTPPTCGTGTADFQTRGDGFCGTSSLSDSQGPVNYDTTDTDVATLIITNPNNLDTVSDTVIVQLQVGTEGNPENMQNVEVNIDGAGWTSTGVSWNSGTSRWEYSWDTASTHPGSTTSAIPGVTIDARGTDPDCGATANASQISVTVDNTCSPAVSITGFNPSEGIAGTTSVTIDGSGFGASQGAGFVQFNVTNVASYTSWNDSQIVVTVPSGATTGPITVQSDAGCSNATGSDFGVCTRNNPSITFIPSSSSIKKNESQLYTVRITNNDQYCSATDFSYSLGTETGDTSSFDLTTFTDGSTGNLASGAFYDTSMTVNAAAGAVTGHQMNSPIDIAAGVNHGAVSNAVTTSIAPDWADNSGLLHNANRFGTCSDSTYSGTSQTDCEGAGGTWTPTATWSGNWGLEGGQYGGFVCETCHTKNTTNIKRIRETIDTSDGSNWPNSASTTATITFTQADGTNSDMGDTTAPYNGVCNVCHSDTLHSNYYWNGSNSHNAGTDCTTCHKHNTGFVGDGPCMDCHNQAQSDLYNTRQVVGAGGDFVRLSRHVSDGTSTEIVTNYDCIVCHAEGDANKVAAATGWLDNSKHKNGTTANNRMVKLRNVDSISQTYDFNKNVVDETMRTDMDTFCMNCHDADGASGINVNATSDGLNLNSTRALTPFNPNDNLRNGRDGFTTRTRVIDVKSQFDTANPSHHAVRGARYSSINSNWTSSTWTSHTLRNGDIMNVVRETGTLHCADCHLTENNAHGAQNAWHMLQSGTPDDNTTDYAMTNASFGTTAATVCWKCHSSSVYTPNSPSSGSRFTHSGDTSWDVAYAASSNGANLGPTCLTCHGGDGFGHIHGRGSATDGDNGTYTAGSGTYGKYRFMPGAWMQWKPGSSNNDNAWTETSGSTCYFPSSASAWSNCTNHQGGSSGSSANYGRATTY
jgi:hypothetical protein